MFLNVQHITIVIVGDGASTSLNVQNITIVIVGDGASTFLNVQHITIVIVGDGASTSRFNETFYIAFFVVFIASFRGFFVKNSVATRFAFTFKIIYIII